MGYAEELQKMTVMLPKANLIQQISLDEYEKVKQLWKEQYEKLDPPAGVNRVEWIKRDVQIISEVISALDSEDTTTIHQALEKVAQIVPFLLLGGFTLTETQAYLRAKLEAAKSVLEVLEAKQEEVSSRIADDKTFNEQPMSMSLDEAKTT